ncbi:MAG: DM13 domain-containing protein [Pseudomonadota bacterium]
MKNTILAVSLTVLGALASVQAQAAELASGSLQGAFSSWGKSSLQGDWKIVEDGGAQYIELDDNFRAKKGPDVKIFLSPTPSAQVTGDNAVDGSVFVELISDFDGSARIEIPAGTDLTQFQSLVFHCEAYSKLWGSSPLR